MSIWTCTKRMAITNGYGNPIERESIKDTPNHQTTIPSRTRPPSSNPKFNTSPEPQFGGTPTFPLFVHEQKEKAVYLKIQARRI